MQSQPMNIIIAGVGGQGTLLTSRIIAQVALQIGYDVKVSEVHGMAQRGGSVVSQVRYGGKLFSPIIKKGDADIILAFEKMESARWLEYLKPDGMIIINNTQVNPLPVMSGKVKYPEDIHQKVSNLVKETVVVDATDIATRCGNSRVANVVLLGVLAKALGIPEDEVIRAIKEMVPPGAIKVNLEAFKEGQRLLSRPLRTPAWSAVSDDLPESVAF